MDKTWTWGELYREVELLTEENSLDPRWDNVVNLFGGDRGEEKVSIDEFLNEICSFHYGYEEVNIPNSGGNFENEFSIAIHPNGDILLGKDWMIENFICEDYS